MNELLNNLYAISPFYFVIAGIASVVYMLKLAFFAFSGISKDLALDVGDESEIAFKFVTFQTLLIFFMGFGWLGLALKAEFNAPDVLIVCMAIVFGLLLMFFAAFMAKIMMKLSLVQCVRIVSLIGIEGMVYLTIPAAGRGEGSVEVILNGAKKNVPAITMQEKEIVSFSRVKIIDVQDKHIIVEEI